MSFTVKISGRDRADQDWDAQDDDFLVEVIHLIHKLELGPDPDERCEVLHGRYETYALQPVVGDPRRMLLTLDTYTSEFTYLGFTQNNPGCEDAYREACVVLGLVSPTREK